MLYRDVAEGIHRLEIAHTNQYLVETGDRLLVVDAGLPAAWPHLLLAVHDLGYTPSRVEGILLTHGHFDHVGTAARAHREWGTPVFVHPGDTALAAHPYSYRPQTNRLGFVLGHPGGLLPLGQMLLAGAANVDGIEDTEPLESRADVPGSPWIIETPGHTDGHVALHFADRDAVIVGDALVTFDPYTGGIGPRVVAPAATADMDTAVASLSRLEDTEARHVLPGHGPQWSTGVRAAVAQARRTAGAA
ncbi:MULTISPECIES: MBL fold metallo-hydrolase [unclassified Curtobacterium]|uniref:MBL fold metallo-hydrolase n=1 Tax=unclassified Curtobacterium TaxID=257496 RepID=UPI000F4BB06B|nr:MULTISPECIES: MBL fold metallo-hydrolase [unclassified Curtobacterium]ROP65188.1 glyoxylase-like metal-dependent hydrolase (beta-lactamase superfamily II) [Curtobacterium sp. ZW137]TCK65451.1 glyoxylase-like metal-dependent hydrolase (beta-lactamase superfamily II) [Curtobacterium sp. PhB136]